MNKIMTDTDFERKSTDHVIICRVAGQLRRVSRMTPAQRLRWQHRQAVLIQKQNERFCRMFPDLCA